MALHDDIEHTLVFVSELILVELAESQTTLKHDLARAVIEIAAEDLHERRLAATIRADQAIAVAVGELDSHLLEQWLRTELDRNVGR